MQQQPRSKRCDPAGHRQGIAMAMLAIWFAALAIAIPSAAAGGSCTCSPIGVIDASGRLPVDGTHLPSAMHAPLFVKRLVQTGRARRG
jgi:hypothetical protein